MFSFVMTILGWLFKTCWLKQTKHRGAQKYQESCGNTRLEIFRCFTAGATYSVIPRDMHPFLDLPHLFLAKFWESCYNNLSMSLDKDLTVFLSNLLQTVATKCRFIYLFIFTLFFMISTWASIGSFFQNKISIASSFQEGLSSTLSTSPGFLSLYPLIFLIISARRTELISAVGYLYFKSFSS